MSDGDLWREIERLRGEIERLRAEPARSLDGERRGTAVLVAKVEGAAAGNGYYTGRLLHATSDTVSVGSGLVAATLGTPSGPTVFLANVLEVGVGGHDLNAAENTNGRHFLVAPWRRATDGKDVYWILCGLWLKDCG